MPLDSLSDVDIRMALASDGWSIADIYNQAIADRCATFETTPRSTEQMVCRVGEDRARYPVLIAESKGNVLGWASINAYRPRGWYAGIGEFSVYVDRGARGHGAGKLLVMGLVREAAARGYWKLVSRVFSSNQASRALCASCGFREVGIYEKHGKLDGQWLDVVIVERLIPENQG